MNRKLIALAVAAIAFATSAVAVQKNELRAPAYPLVTIDPYTSAWSMSDKLYETPVRHWTGSDFPLVGVVKVDGKCYRFMGEEELDLRAIVPGGEIDGWNARYTTNRPSDEWILPNFDDSKWKTGMGAFGTKESEPTSKTQWSEEKIWVRRVIEINEDIKDKRIYFDYSHDDDAKFYINGHRIINTGNSVGKHKILELTDAQKAYLKPGKNVVAAYCWNRGGNALLDFAVSTDIDGRHYFESAAEQTSADVQATQTLYTFACGPVDLKVDFAAPMLMDNLDLLTRPVNYISYQVTSRDGKKHDVAIYLEASPRWAVNEQGQRTTIEQFTKGGIAYFKCGSVEQGILKKKGDDLRIDWGYFYLATPNTKDLLKQGSGIELRRTFAGYDGASVPQGSKKMAIVRNLGAVSAANGYFMIGYDDIYSIQYFGENLRPYWNRNADQTITGQFEKAKKEYKKLIKACDAFDDKLMADATSAGGRKYAELCALAYRQSIAAHKLVKAPNGDLLWLSKENFSNGSIGTVDVTYPSAPLFLLYNTELAKGLLNHIFYYSESGKWTKDFPAHDVGTYPIANGQTYGGDMPVEEGGNMVILTAAITAIEGNADYAAKHWDSLTTWTKYLVKYGLDPENQLCTDDFAGHFAHNTNLAVKAILGVASYGYMAKMLGKDDVAKEYTDKARWMAGEWKKNAADGDHYRLTFDKAGTWSQKYNMVWDKILGFNIFDADIFDTEMAYYKKVQRPFGLPLDNREDYTKSDWVIWTATMASNQADFEALIDPLYRGFNETVSRVPMSDWVYTSRPVQRGFQARSVVGGYFIKMLAEKMKK